MGVENWSGIPFTVIVVVDCTFNFKLLVINGNSFKHRRQPQSKKCHYFSLIDFKVNSKNLLDVDIKMRTIRNFFTVVPSWLLFDSALQWAIKSSGYPARLVLHPSSCWLKLWHCFSLSTKDNSSHQFMSFIVLWCATKCTKLHFEGYGGYGMDLMEWLWATVFHYRNSSHAT